jgi:AcrR family transcriptional regulator
MPKVTDEHTEARRRQILAAALACFAREGFHRATMQDIFREAELSPGAVYSYFSGKDELIEAIAAEVIRFGFDLFETLSRPGPEGRLHTPGEGFAMLVRAFRTVDLSTWAHRSRLGPQLLAEAQRNPVLRERVTQGLGRGLTIFAALARAAQERGELARQLDPEHVARLIFAAFHGLLIQLSVMGDAVDVDAYVETVAALLDAGADTA